jgi:hypothetical protein
MNLHVIKQDIALKEEYTEEIDYGFQKYAWMDELLVIEWNTLRLAPVHKNITYPVLQEWSATATLRLTCLLAYKLVNKNL